MPVRGHHLCDAVLRPVEGGFGFCDVVFGWDMMDVTYDNTTHTGWHKGYPDVVAKLDLGTLRTVPWDSEVPFFLGDFVVPKDGKDAPLPICPRQTLKRVIERAKFLPAGLAKVAACDFGSPPFTLSPLWFGRRESVTLLLQFDVCGAQFRPAALRAARCPAMLPLGRRGVFIGLGDHTRRACLR